jgi:hypothetical protein
VDICPRPTLAEEYVSNVNVRKIRNYNPMNRGKQTREESVRPPKITNKDCRYKEKSQPLYRSVRIHYSEKAMWNVEQRFSPKAIESLAALGFAVGSTRGVVRVEKYGCGAEFRKGTDDLYQMTIIPTIMLKGQFTRLWDAGYQKFLLTDEGLKLPALAFHLANLRKFNEELLTALGVPTFYNEALGSVSQVSVYDRVKGRKGDVPDETVGAHEAGGGH